MNNLRTTGLTLLITIFGISMEFNGGQITILKVGTCDKSRHWEHAANIYELISKLIREQGAAETLLFLIEAGNIKRHSNSTKYKQINEIIDIITREYIMGNKNVEEFLLGIAHNLSQPTNISL